MRRPNIQAFTGLSYSVSRDVQCPAGCGTMEYKTTRNLKIRAWNPLGSVFYLVGLILIVNYIEVGSDETNPGVIIGALLFIPGVYLSSLVTTDLRCNTCAGVILESKSIDQKLKGDAFGLALNKAKYVREALSASTQEGEHDCPDCGKKMSHISVPLEGEARHRSNHLVPDIVENIQKLTTASSRTIDLDGCKECDMLWFDKAKKEEVLSRDDTIILKHS